MIMEKKRCVVLGAGGFIGTALCQSLLPKVKTLKAFGRTKHFPDVFREIHWITGDFNDPSNLALAIEGCDIVYHLVNASTPSSSNSDILADAQNNIIPTLKLLDICRNQNVERVVFVSSGGTIYGKDCEIPTVESAPNWPISAYGISKIVIEKYLYLYNHLYGLDYRILRVSNPFGPYQIGTKNQGVIATFIKNTLLGREIEIWGDGTTRRDYIYIDDLIRALELSALHEGNEKLFNIGSGVSYNLNEVIEKIIGVTGITPSVKYLNKRNSDVPNSVLNIDLAANSLKWKPSTEFDLGVESFCSWMEDYLKVFKSEN